MPRLLVAGSAAQDFVFRYAGVPRFGIKQRAEAFAAIGGGCAGNAAVAIARLGGQARLVAPVGTDLVGERILAELSHEGVDVSAVLRVAGAASSLSAIVIDGAGERTVFSHRPGGLAEARVTDPAALLEGVDAVLVDNRFPEMVLPLMQAARERTLPVVLDGDRPTRETGALVALATHAVFAEDGLAATTGTEDVAEGLARAARMTEGLVAVTLGGRGVVWREGHALMELPAFAVEVVDTLGAGDVFHGAFALALAEGQGVADAMRFAAAAAALKCTCFGGRAATPNRIEVEALLRQGLQAPAGSPGV